MPYRTPGAVPPPGPPHEPRDRDDALVGMVLLVVAAPRLVAAVADAALWEPGAALALAMALLGLSCLPIRRLLRRVAGRRRRR